MLKRPGTCRVGVTTRPSGSRIDASSTRYSASGWVSSQLPQSQRSRPSARSRVSTAPQAGQSAASAVHSISVSTQTTRAAVAEAHTTSGSQALATITGPLVPARSRAIRQARPSALISWCRSSWSRLKLRKTRTSGSPLAIMSLTTRSSVSSTAMSAWGALLSADAIP